MTLLFLAKCRVVRCFFLLLCACCGRLFLRANDHPRVFWVLADVEAQRDDAVGSDARRRERKYPKKKKKKKEKKEKKKEECVCETRTMKESQSASRCKNQRRTNET